MSWDPCVTNNKPLVSPLWYSTCPEPGWCPSGWCSNACLLFKSKLHPLGTINLAGGVLEWTFSWLEVTPPHSTQLLRHAVSLQEGEKGQPAEHFSFIAFHDIWMSRVRGLPLISHLYFPFLWVSMSQIKNLNNLLWLQSTLSNGKVVF